MDTGARIQFDQSDGNRSPDLLTATLGRADGSGICSAAPLGDGGRQATLSGSQDAIEHAEQIIMSIIKEVRVALREDPVAHVGMTHGVLLGGRRKGPHQGIASGKMAGRRKRCWCRPRGRVPSLDAV
jgi:hypothetical protein